MNVQKCAKFEKILKKGSLIRLIIARMKQLEYAVTVVATQIYFSPWILGV